MAGRVDRTRYRRTPYLVCFWRGDQRRVYSQATGAEVAVTPPLLDVLDQLTEPRSIPSLSAALGDAPASLVRQAVSALRRVGLVERVGASQGSTAGDWGSWAPVVAHFHSATKDVRFRPDRIVMRSRTPSKAPPSVKAYPGTREIRLAHAHETGEFPLTLTSRRTWRRFGRQPLTLQDLSTILGLTWGVRHWMVIAGQTPAALKTSPSGGARHSIEAYVIVRRVRDLRPGIYHFNPDRHILTRVGGQAGPPSLRQLLPAQPWYGRAAAVFVMTSVFERVRARYHHPRAYRGVLLEAGHLSQTFCLVATWLGLAPFCTNAFADTAIERALGVDGIRESAVYVTGVGSRPLRAEWAPLPSSRRPLPRLLPPDHHRGPR